MRMAGWGLHPEIEAELLRPRTPAQARGSLKGGPLIPRGLGRSYGDSALAPRVMESLGMDLLGRFDPARGVLEAQAGVSLDDILRVFVPRGYFPAVTPGTKYVTLGGAIAADVHGKNHHGAGCFSECVESLDLLTGRGEVLRCSRSGNPDAFRATCGGMGLTGVILSARIRLRRVGSAFLRKTTHRARCLEELLDLFEATRTTPYSVAWIDCLKRGASLGRSVLDTGDFEERGPLTPHRPPAWDVPWTPPVSPVRPWTMRLFNALVYRRAWRRVRRSRTHYEPFFYPLDALGHWNRLYGARGFTQYQFVVPREAGPKGLRPLLETIAESGKGSFLAVLKAMGPANANPLSFPREGYTLALDFRLEPGLFPLLRELDARVLDLGGRVYLAKDVRLEKAAFRRMYPGWRSFQETRARLGADGRFASLQSRRLGLD